MAKDTDADEGAPVALEAGGRTQRRFVKGGGSYLSSSDRRLVFGLGETDRIDRLTVTWPDGARLFACGAEIHTENSYKYSRTAILDLLQQSGFGQVRCWSDADNRYLVCHARAT